MENKNRLALDGDGAVEIRQSNELTLASQDFTLVQMRLKYRIIQQLQRLFAGIPLSGGEVDPSLVRQYTLRIPLASVDQDNHYDRVRRAAREMSQVIVSYEDADYEWVDFHIIDRVARRRAGEHSGEMEVTVSADFIRCLLSQRGWQTFYEVDRMVSLSSVYSMRMYELVARQDRLGHSLNFTFPRLKAMLGLQGRYARLDDFVRRVVRPAQLELDRVCPYTFTFTVSPGTDGTPVFRFTSVRQRGMESQGAEHRRLRGRIALCVAMSDVSRHILTSREYYGFTATEVRNNLDLFLEFQRRSPRRLDIVLLELLDSALEKDNPKGWLIGALRGRLSELS